MSQVSHIDIFSFNWREWEPFQTQFVIRSLSPPRRQWDANIAKEIADEDVKYVQAFIDVTLGNGELPAVRRKPINTDQRIFFVKFFWALYEAAEGKQERLCDAEALVSRYRKKFGCYGQVDIVQRFLEPNDSRSPLGPGPGADSEVELTSDRVHHPAFNSKNTVEDDARDFDAAAPLVTGHKNGNSGQSIGDIDQTTSGFSYAFVATGSQVEKKRKAEHLSGFDSDLTSIESDNDASPGSRTKSLLPPLNRPYNPVPARGSRRSAKLSKTGVSTDATAVNQFHDGAHHRRKQRRKSTPATVVPDNNTPASGDGLPVFYPTGLASHAARLQQLAQVNLKDEKCANDGEAMPFAREDSMLLDPAPEAASQSKLRAGTAGESKDSKGKTKISANSTHKAIAAYAELISQTRRGSKQNSHSKVRSNVMAIGSLVHTVEPSERARSTGYSDEFYGVLPLPMTDSSIHPLEQTQALLISRSESHNIATPKDSSVVPMIYPGMNTTVGYENVQVFAPARSTKPKPPLLISPPIWAQSRQEICESCDFFRSYQGGVYHTKGFAKGYLLGGFPALRDLFHENGKLIISHGGGKAASKVLDAEDQSAVDHSVSALLNTYRTKQPIVLIADDKYAEFPFDLTRSGKEGYAYIVLGYYLIRNYWAERHPADNSDGYVVRYKFAFQWCGSGEPWWIHAAQSPINQSPPYMIANETCPSCNLESPRIYAQGWMCLYSSCLNFFHLTTGPATHIFLQYIDQFLHLKPLPKVVLPELHPSQPITSPENGINTTPLFYRGWHCPCGRLSSRVKWEYWECAACQKKLLVAGKIRSHKDFWGSAKMVDYEHFSIEARSGIVSLGLRSRNRIGYFTFVLPNNWGRIHMVVAAAPINAEVNDIFQQYQMEANSGRLPFRRFPLRSHQCRGILLTNYFSQNCGAPYQYVGGADRTLPFDQCPPCVIRARTLIEDRASLVLDKRPRFNELLNAAYMEKQSMAFHTDNEKGLGSVVSSLSMGSSALMKFRSIHDKKVGLSLVLRHGDVVVMEGPGVQNNYEHTVIPQGFRLATTARWIGNENMSEGAWRR